MVEQRTENPRVGSSILPLATISEEAPEKGPFAFGQGRYHSRAVRHSTWQITKGRLAPALFGVIRNLGEPGSILPLATSLIPLHACESTSSGSRDYLRVIRSIHTAA